MACRGFLFIYMQKKPRAGCRFYNGVEIPDNAVIQVINEKECYLFSITNDPDCWKYHYRVIENGSVITKSTEKTAYEKRMYK